jgi:hypothetical protein
MPIQSKLTEEQKQTLREMLERGCGYAQCSSFFDNLISKQRCKQYAQKWGIDSKTIRKQKTDALLDREKTKKWGAQWRDKEWLKSEVYRAMREKFSNKKRNAVCRGIEFSISFGELEFPTHCPILNIELDYFSEGRQENSPSFDRFDPSKGYVSENVAVVSWRANRIKNDGTAEEHQKIADWMAKHQ